MSTYLEEVIALTHWHLGLLYLEKGILASVGKINLKKNIGKENMSEKI